MSGARRSPAQAPGQRIGGGRLRVDAARATSKLRDYQLPDGAMWILEVLRAAVARGSAWVRVDGDADDVWCAFECEPPSDESMARLFDELVSPAPGDAARWLRLLATGVNTALGLSPRWVDVYAVRAERDVEEGAPRVTRVRYAPSLLASDAEGVAAGLRALAAVAAHLPADAPAPTRGVLVHFRRLPALEALSLLVTGREPRELVLVRRAAEDLPIPLGIGHSAPTRRHAGFDLLRLRIETGDDAPEDFLALTDPAVARSSAWVDLAELGVVLASQPLDLGIPVRSGARVPVRARIDRKRLPTNASRAAVRADDDEIVRALERARERVPELVSVVARELGPGATQQYDDERRARLRAAALRLLATIPLDLAAALRDRNVAFGAFEPLAKAPILFDAIGRPRSLAELAEAGSDVAHYDDTPMEPDLAPWVGDVPWLPPGDPALALFGDAPPPSARDLRVAARAARAARARFLARPHAPSSLPVAEEVVLVVQLASIGARDTSPSSMVGASALRVPGLFGELALLDPRHAGEHTVSWIIEDREITRERASAELPYDVLVGAPQLHPSLDFRGVIDDPASSAVRLAVDAWLVVACETVARRLAGAKARRGERVTWNDVEHDDAVLAAIVRRAGPIAIDVYARTTGTAPPPRVLAERASPIAEAPVWPRLGGAPVSLDDIARATRDGRVIGWTDRQVGDGSDPHVPGDRMVLVLPADERAHLAASLGGLRLVSYRGVLPRKGEVSAAEVAARLSSAIVLEIEESGLRGAIGYGGEEPPAIRLLHCGRMVARAEYTGASGACSIFDDDLAFASDDWSTGGTERAGGATALSPQRWEGALALALARHVAGDVVPGLHVSHARPFFALMELAAAGAIATPSALPVEVRRELRTQPRLPMMFAWKTLRSVEEIARENGGTLPYVDPMVHRDHQPVEGFVAASISERVARGIARVLAVSVKDVSAVLEQRQRSLARDRKLAEFLERPVLLTGMEGAGPSVPLHGDGIRAGHLVMSPSAPHASVEIRLLGRAFGGLTDDKLPWLRAMVDVDATLADETITRLSDAGLSRVRGALRDATRRLLAKLASEQPTLLVGDEQGRALLGAWLASLDSKKRKTKSVQETLAAFRAARGLRTVQGGIASADDATSGKSVRIAEDPGTWLGPSPDERPSAYDDPVLLVTSAPDDPVRRLLTATLGLTVRDVGTDVRRLLAARRVAQGLTKRPALERVADPALRWKLETLAAHDASITEILGMGEVALAEHPPSRLTICSGGLGVASVEWDLRPPVHIAAEPPDVQLRAGTVRSKEDREQLEKGVRAVIARVLRTLADDPGAPLPGWARSRIAESCVLGGVDHLRALETLPIFETISGAFVSPEQLREQAKRFGDVWYVGARTHERPLDPDRVVLILAPAALRTMSAWCELLSAGDELRLDELARRNRARPRVSAVEPRADELSAALAIVRAPIEGGAVVLPLLPGQQARRGLRAHLDRLPLDPVPDGCRWPTLALLDSSALVPDRTWSRPEEGALLERIRGAIEDATERGLAERVRIPEGQLASLRIDASASETALRGGRAQVRGALWLAPIEGAAVVHVTDAVDLDPPRAWSPSTVSPWGARVEPPITGQLIVDGVAGVGAKAVLESTISYAYRELVLGLARSLERHSGEALDLRLGHLVRAASLGYPSSAIDSALDPTLPCLGGARLSQLARALRDRKQVLFTTPDAAKSAREALSWTGLVLVDDGSFTARIAHLSLGPLAVTVRDLIAPEEPIAPAAPAPPPPEPVPTTPGEEPEPVPLRAPPAPPPAPELTSKLLPRLTELLSRFSIARERGLKLSASHAGAADTLVRFTPEGAVLSLAHPSLARLARAGASDDAIHLLAAHLLGELARRDEAPAIELSMLATLLGPERSG